MIKVLSFFKICKNLRQGSKQAGDAAKLLFSPMVSTLQQVVALFLPILLPATCQQDLINYFPFLASVQLHGKHACSGALLSSRWLLTAAHCVEGQIESWVSIRVGSSSRYEGGQLLRVDSIKLHPHYNPLNLDCNIALIKVESVNNTNSTVNPIKLANLHKYGGWREIEPHLPMLAVGWPPDGFLSTSNVHVFGPKLRAISVNSVDQSFCDEEYMPFGGLTNRMFCVETKLPTESLCNGDGGAPLIVGQTLVGLISHGLGCLVSGVPTVATKVPYFNNWIRSVLEK